ncbi:MAG: Tat pathway signal protein, partial [Acidobacteria bacterium]|nr:Tat pathway signal protein [Acidobacteriota bacterium]
MTHDITRRRFWVDSLALASVTVVPPGLRSAAPSAPWYRRALRWGQTNITEKDPVRYDIAWWREYWKRTEVQGVIINAGGIVAYYPSKFSLHYRAESLGDRDLFGELTAAAHQDGIVVLARMDSNRASA